MFPDVLSYAAVIGPEEDTVWKVVWWVELTDWQAASTERLLYNLTGPIKLYTDPLYLFRMSIWDEPIETSCQSRFRLFIIRRYLEQVHFAAQNTDLLRVSWDVFFLDLTAGTRTTWGQVWHQKSRINLNKVLQGVFFPLNATKLHKLGLLYLPVKCVLYGQCLCFLFYSTCLKHGFVHL